MDGAGIPTPLDVLARLNRLERHVRALSNDVQALCSYLKQAEVLRRDNVQARVERLREEEIQYLPPLPVPTALPEDLCPANTKR